MIAFQWFLLFKASPNCKFQTFVTPQTSVGKRYPTLDFIYFCVVANKHRRTYLSLDLMIPESTHLTTWKSIIRRLLTHVLFPDKPRQKHPFTIHEHVISSCFFQTIFDLSTTFQPPEKKMSLFLSAQPQAFQPIETSLQQRTGHQRLLRPSARNNRPYSKGYEAHHGPFHNPLSLRSYFLVETVALGGILYP